jgi:hypothetical protein
MLINIQEIVAIHQTKGEIITKAFRNIDLLQIPSRVTWSDAVKFKAVFTYMASKLAF